VIGFAGGTGTRSALMSELARAGITFRPVMEMAFSSTILGMVEAGLGVAALTSFALPPAGHPALVSIRLTHPLISREVGIVTASSRAPTPAAAAFIETIRAYAVTLTEHRPTA
jgi:DNA-binding transcriptional LysR family regulator